MLKFEFYEPRELYKEIRGGNCGSTHEVQVDGEDGDIRCINTHINALPKEKYKISTAMAIYYRCVLPFEQMRTCLPKFTILTANTTQIVLENENVRYEVSNRGGSFHVTLIERIPTQEKFESVLRAYAEIVSVLFECHYKEKNKKCPDIYHTLGKVIYHSPNEPLNSEGTNITNILGGDLSIGDLEKKIEIPNPGTSFDDIGGCSNGKKEMLRIYADIINPEAARFFGRDPNAKKGYLILGESGNGKTMLVKALATLLKEKLDGKIKFYAVNYEDITSIFRGGEAQATGKLFDLVGKNEADGFKTLLFLDELHLIGSRRKDGLGPKDEGLDTLLTHLDGMRKYKGLVVIGATYLPAESLDPALIREGRLSNWVTIGKPTEEEREDIFKIYIPQKARIAADGGNNSLFGDLDLQKLAEAADGKNGSDISGIIETVIQWKEDGTKQTIEGEGMTKDDLLRVFTPISTEDILEAIKAYRRAERPKRVVGFR